MNRLKKTVSLTKNYCQKVTKNVLFNINVNIWSISGYVWAYPMVSPYIIQCKHGRMLKKDLFKENKVMFVPQICFVFVYAFSVTLCDRVGFERSILSYVRFDISV